MNPLERSTLSVDAWKALAAKGEAPKDVRLIKAYAGVVEKAEGDPATAPLRIRITTAQRDRDRDTISAAGWKLENFRKNPVVLFAHNSRGLPIARDDGLTLDESGLVGTPRFCDAEMNPMGPMVERMLRGGFLNAASVGFLPMIWQINEQERGYDFLEQELLEYSIVPIPANPGALVIARASGIDIAPLAGWLEALLDDWPTDAPVPIKRAVAERALKIVNGDPAQGPVKAEVSDLAVTACKACAASCRQCAQTCDACAVVCERCRSAAVACAAACRACAEACDAAAAGTLSMADCVAACTACVASCASCCATCAACPNHYAECMACCTTCGACQSACVSCTLACMAVGPAMAPSAPKSADDDDVVLELLEEPSEPTFDVDPDELRAMVGAAVGPAVGESFTALTGRLY